VNTLRRIDDLLAAGERILVVVLFTALVAILVFTIAGRNLLQYSRQELLELIPVLVLWIALLGGSLALRHGRHIRLEVLLRYASPPTKRWAAVVVNAFGAVLMSVLLLAAVSFVRNEVAIFGSWGWLSVIFPIFFSICSYRFAFQMMEALADAKRPPGAPAPTEMEGT
jgi:TRAP-type C4-dicarboxylate transport system permease small subunit